MKAQKFNSFSEIAPYLEDVTRRTFIRCDRWSDNVWVYLEKTSDVVIMSPYFWSEKTESFAKIMECPTMETLQLDMLIYEDWYVCFG